MTEKVVHLRGSQVEARHEPEQLRLFKEPKRVSGLFVFLNIDLLDQQSFLKLIAENSVSTIVDVRNVPIFSTPDFDHVATTSYLMSRGISYIEYAMLNYLFEKHSDFAIAREIHARREDGLTLCIYDRSSMDAGVVGEIKEKFRRSKLYAAEITPRSLSAHPS
jgi:hypothetical protein